MSTLHARCLALSVSLVAACAGRDDDDDDNDVVLAEDLGDFGVSYEGSNDANLQAWQDYYEDFGLLEVIANDVNSAYALPFDATLAMGECGMANAFWSEDDRLIAVCLELADFIAGTFVAAELGLSEEQVVNATTNTLLWVSYHEVGHALIDMLDLPTTGREEDAVDQFSTLIFVEGGVGYAALDAAFWFYLSDAGGDQSALADEHSLGMQRFYNVLCLVYGSDPDTYADVVTAFPEMESRAPRCAEEYADTRSAWRTLLKPHRL